MVNNKGQVAEERRREAIKEIARRLYEIMNKLDPPYDPEIPLKSWVDLSEREHNFYEVCIDDLFDDAELVRSALPATDDDSIFG
jgi:hypothetical protein